jgi:hypothetical protein
MKNLIILLTLNLLVNQLFAAEKYIYNKSELITSNKRFDKEGEMIVKSGSIVEFKGDLELKKNFKIVVEEGATLIIWKSLKADKDLVLETAGNMAVIADTDLKMNSEIKIDNQGTLVLNNDITIKKAYKIEGENGGMMYSFGKKVSFDGKTTPEYKKIGYSTDHALLKGNNEVFYTQLFGATLPVDLVYFRAENKENIELTWATASEENFDYFSVQRSYDAVHFEEIAQVKGAGFSTSIRNYQYNHQEEKTGSVYFRIQSIDFDGYTEIFEMISVYNEKHSETTVYPNPVTTGQFNINNMENFETFRVINHQGNEVMNGRLNDGFNQVNLNNSLPAGFYILVLSNQQDTEQIRLIIR